jgi:hypothetical protein
LSSGLPEASEALLVVTGAILAVLLAVVAEELVVAVVAVEAVAVGPAATGPVAPMLIKKKINSGNIAIVAASWYMAVIQTTILFQKCDDKSFSVVRGFVSVFK